MVKQKQYVVNVFAKTGEANDSTRHFRDLESALKYATETAAEGKRVNVKSRTVEFSDWEYHEVGQ